ncbi:MAG TPA: hypothetical protein VFQ77_13280 [Pseudonocardiaceae bacterium]|nr:hypothetical protein [Pseudonocardiaceae bacterium]
MLLAVLLLLVAAGLLVGALVTGQLAVAWGSAGVSVAAAVMLVVQRWRLSRRRDTAKVAEPDAGDTGTPDGR